MSVQITHVRLSPPNSNDHQAITHVAWTNPENGKSDNSTKPVMVDWIDNKGGSAYTSNGSKRASVGVVKPQVGEPYLRTYADGQWNNNLLSLPRF